MKNCDYCGEEIKSNLRRCPFCGSLLKLENHREEKIFRESLTTEGIDVVKAEIPKTEMDRTETTEDISVEDTDIEDIDTEDIDTEDTDFVVVGEPYNKDAYYSYEEYGNLAGNQAKKEDYGPKPLSNGYKVFLTMISTVIPGFGQLIGIIAAIVFMNSEDDSDRRSFGMALLIASSVMFIFSFFFFFIIILAISSLNA